MREPAVIKRLVIIVDDERRDAMHQALFKGDQTPDPPVPVLKRMDGFKAPMEVHDVLEQNAPFLEVRAEQIFHGFGDLARWRCLSPSHHIGQPFVSADPKPIFRGIRCAALKNRVETFDDARVQRAVDDIQQIIERGEMVGRLNDVVHPDAPTVFGKHRGGLENEPGLLFREAAALDAVGVVTEGDLRLVIQAAFQPRRFLLAQTGKKEVRMEVVFHLIVCPIFPPSGANTPDGGTLSKLNHVTKLVSSHCPAKTIFGREDGVTLAQWT